METSTRDRRETSDSEARRARIDAKVRAMNGLAKRAALPRQWVRLQRELVAPFGSGRVLHAERGE